MVATRRSLGGQASPAAPTTATTPTTKAQQAALKKLNIAGTDALKGDTKAAEAAKQNQITYHYRGATYVRDDTTKKAWIDNQPKRYLKRSSAATDDLVEGDEEGHSPEVPTTKRRRTDDHVPALLATTTTSSSSSASLPRKRKAATLGDEDRPLPAPKRRASTNSKRANSTRRDTTEADSADVRISPARRPAKTSKGKTERAVFNTKNVDKTPRPRVSVSKRNGMDEELERHQREAISKRQAVNKRPLLTEEQAAEQAATIADHQAIVQLLESNQALKAKIYDWYQSHDLLEVVKQRTAKNNTTRIEQDGADAPAEDSINVNQASATEQHEDIIEQQWEREQAIPISNREQSEEHDEEQAHSPAQDHQLTGPEIPETSPAADEPIETEHPMPLAEHQFARPTTESHKGQATAGAHRPQTPATQPANTNRRSGSSVVPSNGNTAGSALNTTPSTSGSSSNGTDPKLSFKDIHPDAVLPLESAGGHRVRWSIERRLSTDGDRAEYAIDTARLDGESKAARARRVKRERELVEGWAKMTGGKVIEKSK